MQQAERQQTRKTILLGRAKALPSFLGIPLLCRQQCRPGIRADFAVRLQSRFGLEAPFYYSLPFNMKKTADPSVVSGSAVCSAVISDLRTVLSAKSAVTPRTDIQICPKTDPSKTSHGVAGVTPVASSMQAKKPQLRTVAKATVQELRAIRRRSGA